VGVGSWKYQVGVTQGTVNTALQKIICHGRQLKENLLVKTLKRETFRATIGVPSKKVLLGAASSHLRNFSCLFSFFSPLSPIASLTALAPVLIILCLDVPFPCGDGGSSFL
jgi:hypothetical protein